MNRRDLLKYLLATPIAATLDTEKLLWVWDKKIFVPSQKQIDFLNGTRPISLYGIPYHQCTGFTGTWLGISRANAKEQLD